jgi:hypothetical protein
LAPIAALKGDLALSSELIREKLKGEVCEADIRDLVRSFASGSLFEVSQDGDLVEIGVIMAENNQKKLEQYLSSGVVKKLDDKTFKAWFESQKTLLMLIVSPFVLVQDKPTQKTLH